MRSAVFMNCMGVLTALVFGAFYTREGFVVRAVASAALLGVRSLMS